MLLRVYPRAWYMLGQQLHRSAWEAAISHPTGRQWRSHSAGVVKFRLGVGPVQGLFLNGLPSLPSEGEA